MSEVFTGSFTQQEAIPEQGIEAALAVLRHGRLHRYNTAGDEVSETALLEEEFAAKVGAKYCIAVASGGYAMATALRALGVQPGESIAIVHPNGKEGVIALYGSLYGGFRATMVNLAATTAGQLVLTLGDARGYFFFVLAAMVYCLALLPTAISATTTPKPLTTVSLDLRGLWRNSPIAFFAVLMVGVSNASFGTLAAVYGARIDLTLSQIALFASIPILAGAVAQIPVGIASDKYDRRVVLICIAVCALIADALFLFGGFRSAWVVMVLAGLFGATVFAMYPVIVAHANDHAAPGTFIQVSGGLLLVYGIGSIAGPTVAGFAMTEYGTASLFAVTGAAHVFLVIFAVIRVKIAPAVAPEAKGTFQAAPLARMSTPETAALGADEQELSEGDNASAGGIQNDGRSKND